MLQTELSWSEDDGLFFHLTSTDTIRSLGSFPAITGLENDAERAARPGNRNPDSFSAIGSSSKGRVFVIVRVQCKLFKIEAKFWELSNAEDFFWITNAQLWARCLRADSMKWADHSRRNATEESYTMCWKCLIIWVPEVDRNSVTSVTRVYPGETAQVAASTLSDDQAWRARRRGRWCATSVARNHDRICVRVSKHSGVKQLIEHPDWFSRLHTLPAHVRLCSFLKIMTLLSRWAYKAGVIPWDMYFGLIVLTWTGFLTESPWTPESQ